MCRTDGCGKYALYGVEDTSSRHLWLVNKGERTSTSPLALDYPLLGPPRGVRAYHCMPESSLGFRCSDQFCHEMFRPLIHRPAPFPLVLGYSRPLVGVNTDSSEIVQAKPIDAVMLLLLNVGAWSQQPTPLLLVLVVRSINSHFNTSLSIFQYLLHMGQ